MASRFGPRNAGHTPGNIRRLAGPSDRLPGLCQWPGPGLGGLRRAIQSGDALHQRRTALIAQRQQPSRQAGVGFGLRRDRPRPAAQPDDERSRAECGQQRGNEVRDPGRFHGALFYSTAAPAGTEPPGSDVQNSKLAELAALTTAERIARQF